MTFTSILLPQALEDLSQIADWYSKNESPSLGFRFIDSFNQTVLEILKHPHSHSLIRKRLSRFRIMKHFPYKIIFYINESFHTVEVLTVVHTARHPRVWKKRVR